MIAIKYIQNRYKFILIDKCNKTLFPEKNECSRSVCIIHLKLTLQWLNAQPQYIEHSENIKVSNKCAYH